MNKPKKTNKLKIDWAETRKIRSAMAKQELIKITLNIDAGSLSALKTESAKTGVPYQRILNAVLKESLVNRGLNSDRLNKIEKEIKELRRLVRG